MADRYTIYQGHFVCHTCKKDVHSLRHYVAAKELTWLCSDKHLSKVSLETKKKKKDYDRTQ